MKQRFRLPNKRMIIATLLLFGLLAGCGYQESGSRSQASGTPKASCPTEDTLSHAETSAVAYTVSWDAVGADADANRGVSALHVSALDVASGKVLWQRAPAKVSALYQSSFQQVVDGVLYIAGIGSQSTLVLAVDTHDGHAIWQTTEKQGGVSMIGVCAGKLYLIYGNAGVIALQTSTGNVLWSYSLEKNVFWSNAVITTQAVYLSALQPTRSGSASQAVIALGADNGKVVWQKSYGTQQGASLSLVANGSAVDVLNQVPSHPSQDPMTPIASVQALDGQSGKVLWQASMPANMEQITALRVGETLYLNGQDLQNQNQSFLVALNASTGKQLWLRKHSYEQLTLLDGQDLYGYQGYAPSDPPQGKKQLCLLDSATGKERWCLGSLQPNLFSLSATQTTVIVEETLQPGPLTLIQNLYGVNKQTGQILWKVPWKSSSTSVQTLTLATVIENQGFIRIAA